MSNSRSIGSTILCRWRHAIISLALVLVGFGGGAQTYAASTCTSTLSSSTVSFGTVSVPDDMPIGTPIKRVQLSQTRNCQNGDYTSHHTDFSWYNSHLNRSSAGQGVYETGTPGFGIKISMNIRDTLIVADSGNVAYAPADGAQQITLTFTLVKTANHVATGASINVPQLISAGLVGYSGTWISLTNTQVGTPTCTPTTSAQSVSLPTISANALKSSGMIAGRTPFNVVLSCQSVSNLSITLTDINNFSNITNMLTLDPSSTAKNVQLQILKPDGTPASYGPDSPASGNPGQWSAGTTRTGTVTIPLAVQYISTGTVTAGTVKAMATYTLSYQ